MPLMNHILILGGTGFVGRSVCEQLVERFGGGSAEIVVPSRHPAAAKHLQPLPTVRVVRGLASSTGSGSRGSWSPIPGPSTS